MRYITSLFAALLMSTNVIAAPHIIFKGTNNKSTAINNVIRDIQKKQPDLYEIVVYNFSDHYVIYLLSGKVWGMTAVRVDVDTSGNVKNITNNYSIQHAELQTTSPNDKPVCPDSSVQFVAISAYPGVGAVNEAIATVSQAASQKYKTMTILNENADGMTYKNWLSCPNLKGFYSIGHGGPDVIIVGNGDMISYEDFADPQFTNKYKDTSMFINSCQAFNYPFGTEITFGNDAYASEYAQNPGPNAYEYLSGHTNLLMFSSERSSACFAKRAIEGAKMDYDTLKECIGDQDIYYQDFGLSEPGKYLNH